MKPKHTFLKFTSCFALLLSSFLGIRAANPYSDVDSKNQDYYGIVYCKEHNLFQADENGALKPDDPITTGQLIYALYALAGSPQVSGDSFPDVPDDSGYKQASIWAKSVGLYEGQQQADGTILFAGDTPLTREQVAELFYQYAQKFTKQVEDGAYLDPDHDYAQAADEPYQEAVEWAVSNNLMRYDYEGTYGTGYQQVIYPGKEATKGWSATFIQHFMDGDYMGDPLPAKEEFQGWFTLNEELSKKYAKGRYNPQDPECATNLFLTANGHVYMQFASGIKDGGTYKIVTTNSQTRIEVNMDLGVDRASTWYWPCATLDGMSCILTSNGILTKGESYQSIETPDEDMDSIFNIELIRTIPDGYQEDEKNSAFITKLQLDKEGLAFYKLANGYKGYTPFQVEEISVDNLTGDQYSSGDLPVKIYQFDINFDSLSTGEQEFTNVKAKASYYVTHPAFSQEDSSDKGDVYEFNLTFDDPQIDQLFSLNNSSLAYYSSAYLGIGQMPLFFEENDLFPMLKNLDFLKFYVLR